MKTKRYLLIIGIALAAQISALVPAGAVTWSFSEVDGLGVNGSTHTVGLYSSLALNAGNPCISYYDSTNGNLMYASWSGRDNAWLPQTVDSGGNDNATVGLYSSLALDTAGNPHIAYYDSTNFALKYASGEGTNWQPQIADKGKSDVGVYPSLVLDTGGRPCICYCDNRNGDLKYATVSNTAWSLETVAKGKYPSLALDSNNILHTSYYNSASSILYYATKDGIWSDSDLDKKAGTYTSLAFSGLNPYIAYTSGEGIKFAWLNGTAWQTEMVDPNGGATSSLSLALDSIGRPHLSYCDSNGTLTYAVKGAGGWLHEPVIQNGQAVQCAGSSVSLKLADSTACLCYTDKTSGKLMCATGSGELPVQLLQQFNAQRKAGSVLLRWRCSEAADAAGFYLYRAEMAHGTYVRVNPHLLAANTKMFRDRDASLSGRCYYKLEIVDSAGNRTVYGPERVQ